MSGFYSNRRFWIERAAAIATLGTIGLFPAKGRSSDESNASKRDESLHPWLADTPPDLARLVDQGSVKLRVDDSLVRPANRTALTYFRFSLSFRTRSRLIQSVESPGVRRIQIVFSKPQLQINHEIVFDSRFQPKKPWETPLLRHEFDHIAISTDPRLMAMLRAPSTKPIEVDIEEKPSATIKQLSENAVDEYLKNYRSAIDLIVNSAYVELDKVSNHGQQSIADRAQLFRRFFSEAFLQEQKFGYLDLVIPSIHKIPSRIVDDHYWLR